jgi:hypothetical protein
MGQPNKLPTQWKKRRTKKDLRALEYLEKYDITEMEQLTSKHIYDLYKILDGKVIEEEKHANKD